MTDRIVLYVITKLHLAKMASFIISLFSQNGQNVFRAVLRSFNMNWVMFQSNKSQLVPNRAAPNRAVSNGFKKRILYLITPAAQGWLRSIWEAVRWNSNMDTLQLLTLSLSGRCAFSVLILVVPHLLPSGSFAILLMADTGSLSPTLHYWCIRECG